MALNDLILQRTAVSERAWTAGSLYDLSKQLRLIFDTEYQRSPVWPKTKKQFLIDSMLRMYDISTIFLRQNDDGRYECLDGQQRLRSIFDFIDGEFPVNPEITKDAENEIYYCDLLDGLKSRIREFIIHSVIVHTPDDAIISDIFLRLQEGMPLNSPEKLNAMPGYMRSRAIELSKHQFFKGIGLANTRFAYRYLAAQILALNIANHFISLKFPTLKRYYQMHKEMDVPESALNRAKSVLNLLENSLGNHKALIKYKADIISLYTLVDAVRKSYSITGIDNHLQKFILDFFNNISNDSQSKASYYKYNTLRSSSADSSKNIEERHEIILSEFLVFFPNIKPLDGNRLFNYHERLAIYLRANGNCEICGKAISFKEGHADHKIRHADGGLTIVENGRWLCIDCNLKLSNQPIGISI